jgi:AcrR family transcriptional regulator
MTSTQVARRQRVLRAVVDLVRAGADEELSMKDIADRSGVALGTIYRYFSSKDHVLAAALVEWARGLDTPGRRPATDLEPSDRLNAVLRRALRAYEREPAFARLLIYVASSTDPFASEAFGELGTVVFGALDRAGDEGIRPEDRDDVMAIIGAVWYQGLTEWTRGRRSIADVRASLEAAVRRLVGQPATIAR